MKNFEIDWEGRLAGVTGELAARRVGGILRSTFRSAVRTGKTLQADLSEYLLYEKQLLPDRYILDEYIRDVSMLSADVEKLQRRIQKLARQQGIAQDPPC